MKKEIIKNRKGQNVVVTVEEHENQRELVFVMHGYSGAKEQPHIQTIADAFKEKEYTVVRFDTTNSVGESDGRLEDATASTAGSFLSPSLCFGFLAHEDWAIIK